MVKKTVTTLRDLLGVRRNKIYKLKTLPQKHSLFVCHVQQNLASEKPLHKKLRDSIAAKNI